VGGAAAAGTPWWSSPQHAALPPESNGENKQFEKVLRLSNEVFYSWILFDYPGVPLMLFSAVK